MVFSKSNVKVLWKRGILRGSPCDIYLLSSFWGVARLNSNKRLAARKYRESGLIRLSALIKRGYCTQMRMCRTTVLKGKNHPFVCLCSFCSPFFFLFFRSLRSLSFFPSFLFFMSLLFFLSPFSYFPFIFFYIFFPLLISLVLLILFHYSLFFSLFLSYVPLTISLFSICIFTSFPQVPFFVFFLFLFIKSELLLWLLISFFRLTPFSLYFISSSSISTPHFLFSYFLSACTSVFPCLIIFVNFFALFHLIHFLEILYYFPFSIHFHLF